jgi:hypothetical protein
VAFWPDIPLVLGVALVEADPNADAVESDVEAGAAAAEGSAVGEDVLAEAEEGPADAGVARDAEVLDAGVVDAELLAMVDVVAVEGVKVAAGRDSTEALAVATVAETEAVTVAGAPETAAASPLALVVCAATSPIDEMDPAAGAAAACITRKPSATAAVVTVLRRGEIRETGISRIPPITVRHEGRYRWIVDSQRSDEGFITFLRKASTERCASQDMGDELC